MIDYEAVLEQILKIRFFEKKVEEYFERGLLRGTTHGCIGQEAIAVAVMDCIDRRKDYVFSTHRCHGHFIAYSGDPYLLIAEMMGKSTGAVKGAGGSQHLKLNKFFTNGITGGMVPIAAGVALGLKRQNSDGIAISFVGDGGFNEGYVQEALNLCAAYGAPVLFVLENNRYAMSTKTEDFTSGTIKSRVMSYQIDYRHMDTTDYEKLRNSIGSAVEAVRRNKKPVFCEVDTFRFCGHSKSDKLEYMCKDLYNEYLEKDPVKHLVMKIPRETVEAIENRVKSFIDNIFRRAETDREITISDYVQNARER